MRQRPKVIERNKTNNSNPHTVVQLPKNTSHSRGVFCYNLFMPMEKFEKRTKVNEQFDTYIQEAIQQCHQLSFSEKSQGVWDKPELRKYLAELPIDEPSKHLIKSISETFPSMEKKKILCVGGGKGRLGRYIAATYPNCLVSEIDNSIQMATEANKLAEEKGQNNFRSIVADARAIPFKDGECDYAVAFGLFRYIDKKNQQVVIDEMLRVAKYGALIAEGKAEDLIYDLKDSIDSSLKIEETRMKMFRMSLFYMLLKKYEQEQSFRDLVDKNSKNKPLELLSQLAGVSEGTLYVLKLKPHDNRSK